MIENNASEMRLIVGVNLERKASRPIQILRGAGRQPLKAGY